MRERLTRLIKSQFVKDSSWAVFGPGLGNGLLLIAGIIIARLLGKDLYGEYGVVKSTMFYIAAFSTFGLGYTSTKYIAQYIEEQKDKLYSVVNSTFKITLFNSVLLGLLVFVFSSPLSNFLETPQLATPFKYLGIIIVFRAVSTSAGGLLSGFGDFKELGINNIVSGLTLLLLCVPLTYYWGLKGSLISLSLSQFIFAILNVRVLLKKQLIKELQPDMTKSLLKFSFPVALQELSFTICNWGTTLILTKYASVGEVGMYTASFQWTGIILIVPSLLSNVILAYLSKSSSEGASRQTLVSRIVIINLLCTLIPFGVALLLSDFIIQMYGSTFVDMKPVFLIAIFSTIFMCLANVFQSELISRGKNWQLFSFRLIRDSFIVVLLFVLLGVLHKDNGAIILVSLNAIAYVIYTALLWGNYHISTNNQG
jgi:Membrane protein involved in the export of O-antigen and teichoic acid